MPVSYPDVYGKSGLDTLEKIDLFVNEHLFDKSEIARFSMIACEAAKQEIHRRKESSKDCAEKIWKLIEDTARKAGWTRQSQVSLASGKEKTSSVAVGQCSG